MRGGKLYQCLLSDEADRNKLDHSFVRQAKKFNIYSVVIKGTERLNQGYMI